MTEHSPSICELEQRMRPGAWSRGGFLGSNESLLDVCKQDCQTLQTAQVTFDQVADALERILQQALQQRHELLAARETALSSPGGALKSALQLAMQTIPQEDEFARRDVHLPNLCAGQPPGFSLQTPPNPQTGYWVDGKWQVFFATFRGLQDCPWECPPDPWADFDFLIFHHPTGEFVTGSGLIVHLIREHQFLEGTASPYRMDPAKALVILELGQSS